MSRLPSAQQLNAIGSAADEFYKQVDQISSVLCKLEAEYVKNNKALKEYSTEIKKAVSSNS